MNRHKDKFDRQAEREGIALKQQGKCNSQQIGRQNHKRNYNKVLFDKLFKS